MSPKRREDSEFLKNEWQRLLKATLAEIISSSESDVRKLKSVLKQRASFQCNIVNEMWRDLQNHLFNCMEGTIEGEISHLSDELYCKRAMEFLKDLKSLNPPLLRMLKEKIENHLVTNVSIAKDGALQSYLKTYVELNDMITTDYQQDFSEDFVNGLIETLSREKQYYPALASICYDILRLQGGELKFELILRICPDVTRFQKYMLLRFWSLEHDVQSFIRHRVASEIKHIKVWENS